jgi:GAF domain-containing protein
MKNTLSRIFFDTKMYSSEEDHLRATFLYIVTSLATLGIIVIIYLAPRNGTLNFINAIQEGQFFQRLWWAHYLFILCLSSFALVRFGYMNIVSWVFPLGFYLIHLVASRYSGFVSPLDYMIIALLILTSGLLLKSTHFFATCLIYISLYLLLVINQGAEANFTNAFQYVIALIVFSILVYTFQNIAIASRREGEMVEGLERFKLANINMQITQQASQRQSLDVAMNSTLELILKNYPHIYHAQIFLINEDGVQARLVASTGEIGKRLLEKGHSLAVGSLSVIGQTTLKNEILVARAGAQDSVHRQNVLLSETSLEVAFPLSVEGGIIGALDLQSRTLADLSKDERLSFQSLANSLALMIDNIRQFEAAKLRIGENQRLAEQTRSALRDVERLNQRLIGRAWSEYLSGKGDEFGLSVDFKKDTVEENSEWTPTLISAVEINNIVKEGNIIAIPLSVRGQVIGAMEFELAEDEQFSPEDLELIQEVSNRFGLAAENTRLVEESQRTAQRETLVNEITSRFQSAQNVEATLAEAARSLSDALGANRIMICLGTPQENANGSH